MNFKNFYEEAGVVGIAERLEAVKDDPKGFSEIVFSQIENEFDKESVDVMKRFSENLIPLASGLGWNPVRMGKVVTEILVRDLAINGKLTFAYKEWILELNRKGDSEKASGIWEFLPLALEALKGRTEGSGARLMRALQGAVVQYDGAMGKVGPAGVNAMVVCYEFAAENLEFVVPSTTTSTVFESFISASLTIPRALSDAIGSYFLATGQNSAPWITTLLSARMQKATEWFFESVPEDGKMCEYMRSEKYKKTGLIIPIIRFIRACDVHNGKVVGVPDWFFRVFAAVLKDNGSSFLQDYGEFARGCIDVLARIGWEGVLAWPGLVDDEAAKNEFIKAVGFEFVQIYGFRDNVPINTPAEIWEAFGTDPKISLMIVGSVMMNWVKGSKTAMPAGAWNVAMTVASAKDVVDPDGPLSNAFRHMKGFVNRPDRLNDEMTAQLFRRVSSDRGSLREFEAQTKMTVPNEFINKPKTLQISKSLISDWYSLLDLSKAPEGNEIPVASASFDKMLKDPKKKEKVLANLARIPGAVRTETRVGKSGAEVHVPKAVFLDVLRGLKENHAQSWTVGYHPLGYSSIQFVRHNELKTDIPVLTLGLNDRYMKGLEESHPKLAELIVETLPDEGSHPYLDDDQIGWARIDPMNEKAWLVEEIQTDLSTIYFGNKADDYRDRLYFDDGDAFERDKEEAGRLAKGFRHAIIPAIVDTAKSKGVENLYWVTRETKTKAGANPPAHFTSDFIFKEADYGFRLIDKSHEKFPSELKKYNVEKVWWAPVASVKVFEEEIEEPLGRVESLVASAFDPEVLEEKKKRKRRARPYYVGYGWGGVGYSSGEGSGDAGGDGGGGGDGG